MRSMQHRHKSSWLDKLYSAWLSMYLTNVMYNYTFSRYLLIVLDFFFCRIENDKVESYSITQSFNKQENWTKALKYTLCNLKWALYWFVGNTNFQPLSAVSSHAEVPGVSSLYTRRGTDSKSEFRNTSNP